MSKTPRLRLFDVRKAAIVALVGLFTLVPIVHVATFVGTFEPPGSEWLGYVYALGLDAGIAVCAWFTRWATTRRVAWVSYGILVAMDGSFNVAYLEPWAGERVWAAWLYALFPTAIVALLSLLARQADVLSATGHRLSATDVLSGAIARRFGVSERQDEPLRTPTVSDWRAIRAELDGNGAALSADDVQRLLGEHGFAPAAPSTARRWAAAQKYSG